MNLTLQFKTANEFVQRAEELAREVLGREYKRHLVKGNLVKECESALKNCWMKSHQDLWGDEFLKRWVKNYVMYFMAEVYKAVYTDTQDNQLSSVFSNAYVGAIVREFGFKLQF
jgi:hypothetical protein